MTTSAPKISTADAAVEAHNRGYVPVAIRDGSKRPHESAWVHTRWDSAEQVREAFTAYPGAGAGGLGVLLGEPSRGLVDVDLDHPKSLRLRDYFLPPSPMATGRRKRPRSHRWYRVEQHLPSTRKYQLPDRSAVVELRSTGAQTVIPPSVHPDQDVYMWEGDPWGGEAGPALVDGRKLAVQVALLAMGAVLLDSWPQRGGRHDAYLALAGGLLRYGNEDVHPYWQHNLPVLISAMAAATNDEDGPEARVSEVMRSTITKLREGGKAVGFPRLAEIIGTDHAELVRRWAKDVESLAGYAGQPIRRLDPSTGPGPSSASSSPFGPSSSPSGVPTLPLDDDSDALVSTLPPRERNPMEERVNSWGPVDLEPYLSGQVTMPEPNVLNRTDGQGLFYPGRVNSLFGASESAKSWIALMATMQVMSRGERVVYLDFEDEPVGTLDRLTRLGVGADDLVAQFRYVHPEGPLAEMQRYRNGYQTTEDGRAASSTFAALLDSFDPTLIVADGMTSLYGLHGHDTNDATSTDVVTTWLKSLCRSGRTTVIVIDHTGKNGGAGSSPIGAHHKIAMVQGTALRVDAVERPMPDAVGTVRLIVFKDRPGVVRKASTRDEEQVAGVVTIDSTTPGQTSMKIDACPEGTLVLGNTPGTLRQLAAMAQLDDLANRILALFLGDLDKPVTTTEAVNATKASRTDVREAWRLLETRGLVAQHGQNRWAHYRLVDPSTQASV